MTWESRRGCAAISTSPYPPQNFSTLKHEIPASGVNLLLKSIVYYSNNCDPKELKKVILVTFDDGRTGRSSLLFDLTIESVDDPTELYIPQAQLTYRQHSLTTQLGFPLLSGSRLVGPGLRQFPWRVHCCGAWHRGG